jgi:hypothetical protein
MCCDRSCMSEQWATIQWCMVAQYSDVQDLSRHTIPRHLQDTAVPLYPHHYSYSLNYYTGCIISLPYQCRCYHYRIYAPLSQCQMPRQLQDATLPLHPRYDSPTLQFTVLGSSLSISTASLPHICTHTTTPDLLLHNARL